MIVQQTINSKKATVAYLDDAYNPVDETDATHVKVMFDDGGVLFGVAVGKVTDDSLIKYMQDNDVQITRQNYIAMAFGDGYKMTPDDEMMLPTELQDWDKYGGINEMGVVRGALKRS